MADLWALSGEILIFSKPHKQENSVRSNSSISKKQLQFIIFSNSHLEVNGEAFNRFFFFFSLSRAKQEMTNKLELINKIMKEYARKAVFHILNISWLVDSSIRKRTNSFWMNSIHQNRKKLLPAAWPQDDLQICSLDMLWYPNSGMYLKYLTQSDHSIMPDPTKHRIQIL